MKFLPAPLGLWRRRLRHQRHRQEGWRRLLGIGRRLVVAGIVAPREVRLAFTS